MPIPQFSPGCHFVPRCLAMMFPGRTSSPPYFLMPKNFGFESRPFDVDPPAFFDANLTRCGCCGCSPPKTTLNDNKEDKVVALALVLKLFVFFKQKRSILIFHPQGERRRVFFSRESFLVKKIKKSQICVSFVSLFVVCCVFFAFFSNFEMILLVFFFFFLSLFSLEITRTTHAHAQTHHTRITIINEEEDANFRENLNGQNHHLGSGVFGYHR